MTALWAGFECAQLTNGHDLLASTRHTPEADMAAHYAHARSCGARGARDGLTPGHDPAARVRAARGPVIWDLAHYRLPDAAHLARVADALPLGAWLLPVNEPMVESLWQRPWEETTRAGIEMIEAFPDAAIVTCDPFHTLDPSEFWATDALVATGRVNLIGLNYYPVHATVPLRRVLREVAARYPRHRIAITETSWHDGHPGNAEHGWPEHWTRAHWWAHVQHEIHLSDVDVAFVAWYPWLDCPPWEDPAGTPWPHGWPGGLSA